MKRFYQLIMNGKEADIYIFGDITSWEWLESDVSSYTLSRELQTIDADTINVHINSYGGEVAEGLAIYNSLKNHPAKIKTICDGFACSAASVIFMAGDERVMSSASLLMVHNAWTYAGGNAEQMRKTAEDLDVITEATKASYLSKISVDADKLSELMDAETWILPADALDMGFATSIVAEQNTDKAAASARKSIFARMTAVVEPPPVEPEPTPAPEPTPEPVPPAENKTIKFLNAVIGKK